MTEKKLSERQKAKAEGKGWVSARIEQSLITKCSDLAKAFNWSLTDVIALAMKNISREDILKTFDNAK